MVKKASYLLLLLIFIGCSQYSYNKNEQDIISELMTFGSLAQAWYRTPVVMHGGEYKAVINQDDLAGIASYIYENAEKNIIISKLGIYTFNLSDVDNFISINCQSLRYPELVIRVIVCIESGYEDVVILKMNGGE